MTIQFTQAISNIGGANYSAGQTATLDPQTEYRLVSLNIATWVGTPPSVPLLYGGGDVRYATDPTTGAVTGLVAPDGTTRYVTLGSVLLRYIATGGYTDHSTADATSGSIPQTILHSTSSSAPYTAIKWGELVNDDLGNTLAQYEAHPDRIIIPSAARMARVNASFAYSAVAPSTLSTAATATANNGSGAVRLTVASTTGFPNKSPVTVAGVSTDSNGTWTATVIDSTHVDLDGSTYTGAAVTAGTMTGSPGTARGFRIYHHNTVSAINRGNNKLFSFHASQSNNLLVNSSWFPVNVTDPGSEYLYISIWQDTGADLVNPGGDLASSFFGAEFM